jgi:hypothetical protein
MVLEKIFDPEKVESKNDALATEAINTSAGIIKERQ